MTHDFSNLPVAVIQILTTYTTPSNLPLSPEPRRAAFDQLKYTLSFLSLSQKYIGETRLRSFTTPSRRSDYMVLEAQLLLSFSIHSDHHSPNRSTLPRRASGEIMACALKRTDPFCCNNECIRDPPRVHLARTRTSILFGAHKGLQDVVPRLVSDLKLQCLQQNVLDDPISRLATPHELHVMLVPCSSRSSMTFCAMAAFLSSRRWSMPWR